MGFFDSVGKFLSGVASNVTDKARRSDDPEVVAQYIKYFDQQIKRADLAALEKMQKDGAFRVPYDSRNDSNRKRKLTNRIQELRKKLSEKIQQEEKRFDQWLAGANLDELERGLSNGKYSISDDTQNDASRRQRIEEKLLPLQQARLKEQKKNDRKRMKQFFQTYLKQMEESVYNSYYAFCDLREELSHLTPFQKSILDETYSGQVNELLAKPVESLSETIEDCKWQVRRQKKIAGKSLIELTLANRLAQGEASAVISSGLADLEDAVLRESLSRHRDDGELELSADELLEKGNKALLDGLSEKANAYYLSAAENGNVEAMYRLGLNFLYGLGIPVNYDKAFLWLSQAAEKNSPEGMYGLSICYRWGRGVDADIERAAALSKKAFILGCSAGAWSLGVDYVNSDSQQDTKSSFMWQLKSAEKGCLSGMFATYVAYDNGHGVEADKVTAKQWFDNLINTASAPDVALDVTAHDAFRNIGRVFENGWTGADDVDHDKALVWFNRGVGTGDRASKTWLIDFNDHECRNRILHELESVNYPWAFSQLAEYYESGNGVDQDAVLANYYYLKAAKYGDRNGQNKIGMAFLNGEAGVNSNEDEAIFWLEKAAAQGVENARNEVEAYHEREAKKQWQRQQAEFQERRSEVLKKKKDVSKRLKKLHGQLKNAESRYDNATNAREEAAAEVDLKAVRGQIQRTNEERETINTELSELEKEAARCGYTV